ncbi:MAG TPA: Ig-like domain-containing protein, partial [Candidatus Polarisedimenticolia bacterium]|nr:Ig-like domain-containing protein [Candidatus Polarisedimenticolia bacterium]
MSGLRRGLTAPRLFRAGLLILAAALLWASAPAAARPAGVDETTSGPLSVRIVSPVASDLAIGKTDVRVEIASPPGVAILKVELYADDRLVATLLDPPWRHVWDAGDTVGARTLRARVFAADGTTASHKVTTRALQGAQRARVTLVEVFCTVRDSAGRYLTDLGKDDFTVLESGKPQEIALFSTQRKPANLVLLFDASASMARDGKLELAQEAAAGFIKALEPDDRAAL